MARTKIKSSGVIKHECGCEEKVHPSCTDEGNLETNLCVLADHHQDECPILQSITRSRALKEYDDLNKDREDWQ